MRRKPKRVRFPKYVSAQTFHDVHCSHTNCKTCTYARYDWDVLDGCELLFMHICGFIESDYFNNADRRRYAAMIRKTERPSKG